MRMCVQLGTRAHVIAPAPAAGGSSRHRSSTLLPGRQNSQNSLACKRVRGIEAAGDLDYPDASQGLHRTRLPHAALD